MINPDYQKILDRGRDKQSIFKRQLAWLGKFNTKNFDHVVADYHTEVFAEIDCLQCGNCCRHLGPRLRESDIKRVSKEIGMDISEFIETKLQKDEDGDWVLKGLPCPFLEGDNSCNVYSQRPHACAHYPHTQDRNIQRHLGSLAKNTAFCPAAVIITEKILDRYCKKSDPDKDSQ